MTESSLRPGQSVGAPEPLAVEANLGQRVEAVEHQRDMPLPGHCLVEGEFAAVLPVALRDPLHAQLLVASEWVRDAARCQEIEVDPSGDMARDPIGGAAFPQQPRTVEGLFGHASPRIRPAAFPGGS
jgi:hypothetical protein